MAEESPIGKLTRLWRQARARWAWLDHLVHAGGVYNRRRADFLAAAITYFGFLALFPVLLLAVSVAGFVLAGRPDLMAKLTTAITDNVPGGLGDSLVGSVTAATDSRGLVGLLGLLGLAYAGIGWISKLRIALQIIWRGEPDQPNFLQDNLRDLVGLIGLGGALLASVALTSAATALTGFVIDLVGLSDLTGISVVTWVLGIAIAMAGDVVIFLWVLVRLPRLDTPYRAALPGAIFGAVGFEILKIIGAFYITRVSTGAAAAALGSIIGILVWIFLVSRFLLFTAAWTTTTKRVEALKPVPVAELDIQGPASPPLAEGPSNAAVAAGLVGVGAVLGAATPPLLRRFRRRQATSHPVDR